MIRLILSDQVIYTKGSLVSGTFIIAFKSNPTQVSVRAGMLEVCKQCKA